MIRASATICLLVALVTTASGGDIQFDESISRACTVFNLHGDFSEVTPRPVTIFNLHGDFHEATPRPVTVFNHYGDFHESIARALTVKNWHCIQDINRDGSVGPADLAMLLGAWGPNEFHPADLDDNGTVGPVDLAMLLGAWGPCP